MAGEFHIASEQNGRFVGVNVSKRVTYVNTRFVTECRCGGFVVCRGEDLSEGG